MITSNELDFFFTSARYFYNLDFPILNVSVSNNIHDSKCHVQYTCKVYLLFFGFLEGAYMQIHNRTLSGCVLLT